MAKIKVNQTPPVDRLNKIAEVLDYLISNGAKEINIIVGIEQIKVTSEGFNTDFIIEG